VPTAGTPVNSKNIYSIYLCSVQFQLKDHSSGSIARVIPRMIYSGESLLIAVDCAENFLEL
jgi:hypothetical protein